ncbi:RES family NAD+ phosphorylase [Rubrobacter aplysinae]|uniref:RES family NAD+ phosphorylase n=1 Tax=Rubrobacter aplysinae TaxID=909625 RepID=UPI00128CF639|nr:RES family NAD+ phosphorylase [Rubrobacter aplysinae]
MAREPVFSPPPWMAAKEDGTFGNRFDDPGQAHEVPQEERFRVIYCASDKAGAFGETLSRFRKSPSLIAALKDIEDEEESEPEEDLQGGVVPIDWRLERSIGSATLGEQSFADVFHPESLDTLRSELAPLLQDFGLEELDLSTITSSHRRITQEASKYIHDLGGSEQRFAGIRYLSRLNPEWELWALFDDRASLEEAEFYEPVKDDDPSLQEVAELFELDIR